ncbi:hypothetical protein ACK1KB_02945 [Chryseobacterium sp. TY3]
MKDITAQKTEDYHLVLKKFINLLLFGSFQNPKFSKNNDEIKIHQVLLDFFNSLQSLSGDQRSDAISSFYDEILVDYRKKISKLDSVDLMNCYGFSNFRILTNIFGMFSGFNLNTAFDPQKRDGEIMSDLIWDGILPDEIKSYLCMQFFDIFHHISHEATTITQEQYKALVDRYVGEYEYNKVINIVYQNFEEVE